MIIYKLIIITVILTGTFILFRVSNQNAYQAGYNAHKLQMSESPAIGNYADIRYIAGTYKRLYQECAGENANISPDLEKMILNLKLGEIWLL